MERNRGSYGEGGSIINPFERGMVNRIDKRRQKETEGESQEPVESASLPEDSTRLYVPPERPYNPRPKQTRDSQGEEPHRINEATFRSGSSGFGKNRKKF